MARNELKIGDKIRVRVKTSNRDCINNPSFAVGREYDAVVQFIEDHGYGYGFQIEELGTYCLEHNCSHLNDGDWEII